MLRRVLTFIKSHPWTTGFILYGAPFAYLVASNRFSDDTRSLIANLWYVPIGLVATALALQLATRRDLPRRQRMAWQLIVVGGLMTALSDTLWVYVENITKQDPSGNLVANLGYLAFYPAMLAAFLLFPEGLRSRRDALKFGLDVATVVIAGTMAVWYFVIAPLVHAHHPSVAAFWLALSYPVGDLLLLMGLATILLRYPRGPRRMPIMLLALSVAAMLFADVVWADQSLSGEYEAGHVQDLFYLVQYVAFAVAVAEERRRLRHGPVADLRPAPGAFTPLPYVAVFGGYALLVGVTWGKLNPDALPLVVGAVLLTMLVVARQIVALKENMRLDHERSLLAGEKRFKSLVQHASDVVSIIDTDWKIRFASPSVVATLGYVPASLLGRSAVDLVHPDDVPDLKARLKYVLGEPNRTVIGHWRIRHGNGHWVQMDNTATNLLGDENIRGLVLTSRDITERVTLEAQLTHQAYHDSLTGLANRALFQKRLNEALDRFRLGGRVLAVLLIDLDEFKGVNDTYGHAFGDEVLRLSAGRILSSVRGEDTAARLGGDEFCILLEGVKDEVDPFGIANRLAQAFLPPFGVEGHEIVATASVGVALAAGEQTAEELQRNADLAMYLSKSRGRGRAEMFQPSLHAALVDKLELQADLRQALASDQLTVFYQPIHDLETGTVAGCEALIRWMHPTRGLIQPGIFVPIAEETGQIGEIGLWTLTRACREFRQATSWIDGSALRLSVNLSGRQLQLPTLVDDVQQALVDSALAPGQLVLELTESMLLDQMDIAVRVMDRLRVLGIGLAIDDFGTGYSSLSYLQRLPIDVLKIDRTFVEQLGSDPGAAAVTRAILAMASTMSLRTVAEGVETAEQIAHLRQLGCHFGQGFFYGRPMTASDFEAHLRRRAITVAA